MAERLNTKDPRLPLVYNVSEPVGPGQVNDPDDVMLVQLLLADTILHIAGYRYLSPPPPINGNMNAITGYHILECQRWLAARHQGQLDGIVSPAKGLQFGVGVSWLISALNSKFRVLNPAKFDLLYQDSRLSASVRKSIAPDGAIG